MFVLKLTDTADDQPVYIDFEKVIAYKRVKFHSPLPDDKDGKEYTVINTSRMSPFTVKETPKEIVDLITDIQKQMTKAGVGNHPPIVITA